MDIQDIHKIVADARKATFDKSDQISLGELITLLEAVHDQSVHIRFDFGWFYPTSVASWRGVYSELALGYDNIASYDDTPKVEIILSHLKEAVGKTYEGWKGGSFTMSKDTPIWCDNYGSGASTAIVGITDYGYQVIINTAYMDA